MPGKYSLRAYLTYASKKLKMLTRMIRDFSSLFRASRVICGLFTAYKSRLCGGDTRVSLEPNRVPDVIRLCLHMGASGCIFCRSCSGFCIEFVFQSGCEILIPGWQPLFLRPSDVRMVTKTKDQEHQQHLRPSGGELHFREQSKNERTRNSEVV